MSVGIQSAPGTLQQTSDVAPSAVKWQLAFFYVENSFVFSHPAAERVDHVNPELTLLRDAELILKLKNYTNQLLHGNHRLSGPCYSLKELGDCGAPHGWYQRTQAPQNVTNMNFTFARSFDYWYQTSSGTRRRLTLNFETTGCSSLT